MINFTTVGEPITKGVQHEFERAFAQLEWKQYRAGDKVSFCTGYLIKAAIEQLRLPGLTHYAETVVGSIAVTAVRAGGYKGGPVNAYIADFGDSATVLASEQMVTEEAVAA